MTRTSDFQRGMTVYGLDGVQLGEVKEVWAETPSHGHLPVSQYLLQDYGPIRGTAGLLDTADGYLHVQQGGMFTSDRQDLYIPLLEVHTVTACERVTLRLPKNFYRARCSELPQTVAQAA